MIEKPRVRSVNVSPLYDMKLIAVDDRPFTQKGKIAFLYDDECRRRIFDKL